MAFHESFMCHFAVNTDLAHLIGCINRTARQRCWPFEGIKWGQCDPFRIQTEQNGSKTHVKKEWVLFQIIFFLFLSAVFVLYVLWFSIQGRQPSLIPALQCVIAPVDNSVNNTFTVKSYSSAWTENHHTLFYWLQFSIFMWLMIEQCQTWSEIYSVCM